MLVHVIKWQHQPTFQDAVNDPKWTLTRFVVIYIFSENLATHLTVGAADWCVFTLSQMLVNISYFRDMAALFIRAVDRELMHESPDWNIGP